MDIMRVLAIDIEGGHGGSSRSLAQFLRALDRAQVEPEVWCRRGGAIEDFYHELGIPVTVHADMPCLTALKRFSRNMVDFIMFFLARLPRSGGFRAALSEKLPSVDLLHLNHISLFWIARWVRRRYPNLPITMHIRTRPKNTIFARWQARIVDKACSNFVFITENERDHMAQLLGKLPRGEVILNPVRIIAKGNHSPINKRNSDDHRLVVLCLSNFAYVRGVDRLIQVAKCLDYLGDENISFVVAGDMHLRGDLPGGLAAIAKIGGTLTDYAKEEGVDHRFTFLGHVKDPEVQLAKADVLLKPTREDNPWGRDILEALGHGVPVASVGTYDRFVETDTTGLLQTVFDADGVAQWLIGLSKDHKRLSEMQIAAGERIKELCDPARNAEKLVRFWLDTKVELQSKHGDTC